MLNNQRKNPIRFKEEFWFNMVFTAKQIAEYVQGRIEGDDNTSVSSFAKIEKGKEGALSFLSNPKFLPFLYDTQSSIVIINNDIILEKPTRATLVRVPNAYKSVISLLKLYTSILPKESGISDLAYVSPKAKIGDNVYVGPFAVICDNSIIGNRAAVYPGAFVGKDVRIGSDCIINSNVSIYRGCQVGNNVIIHSGCVIGSDGFGFLPENEGYEKVPHIGSVIIEDDVEIGANTCIDRGTLDNTIIRRGVKLDNLIHIAHNAEIGSNTVMSAQVGIAGSTKIGEWCMFGGQVGVAGHISIGDRVLLGAQSGVPSSLKDNQQLIGTPPMEKLQFFKSSALIKQLPDYFAEMRDLKKRICELESKLHVVND